MSFKQVASAAAIIVTAAGITLSGRERRPLPAFSVTAEDGVQVQSPALAVDGTWLLVYVQPRCTPCDALLAHMDGDERAAASRIVVIGGGMDAQAMTDMALKYPNLASSRWLADPARTAMKSLAIETGPTVFGVRRAMVEWRLAGTLRNDRELESLLFTWLEKR
jgi:hypothetical protein